MYLIVSGTNSDALQHAYYNLSEYNLIRFSI